MKVAFCVSEVFPFAKTGGLADVAGALPLALESLGVSVDIYLPYYLSISDEIFDIKKVNKTVYRSSIGENISVYLMHNKKYFHREGLYGDIDGDFSDNFERFQWFGTEVLKFIEKEKKTYDVIHCHDWHSALIPVMMEEEFAESFSKVASMFTIHNLAFQGVFPQKTSKKLKFLKDAKHPEAFDFHKQINWLKAALIYSDQVTTVSPNYAQEILTKEFGCGLEETLQELNPKVEGITNGLDREIWNPATDMLISKRFDVKDVFAMKPMNKSALQQRLRLDVNKENTIFGFVGRISHQKGLDLILDSAEELLKDKSNQLVVQGIGDEKYYFKLKALSVKHPSQCQVCFEFDESLAHQIYAGSDFFLMPSQFEPCGLSQLISFRYGTIPIAFATGGLVDTIEDVNDQGGNGILFTDYSPKGFLAAVKRVKQIYTDDLKREQVITQAMLEDFSWTKSARKYKDIYQCLSSV